MLVKSVRVLCPMNTLIQVTLLSSHIISDQEGKEMKMIDKTQIKNTIRKKLKNNGVRKASLFGSFQSGDFGNDSDIDIMIEPDENMSLLDLARLKREIEEVVGFRVDIITYRSLNPRYLDKFMKNAEELI